MNFPLPIRMIKAISARLRWPAFTIGLVTLVVLLGVFTLTGAIYPVADSRYAPNPLEITGAFLLFSFLSAYLLACMVAQVGWTPRVVESLSKQLPVEHHRHLERLDRIRWWPLGLLAGIIFAAEANIPWEIMTFTPGAPDFVISLNLVFGQFLTWSIVGMVLAMGIHNALVLHRVGKLVNVDIYQLDRLNAFGQVGLRSLLMIVGALVLTPLQAIDQEFRWTNYQNAILVGIPAILLLMLIPIWSVHIRIRLAKRNELKRLDEEISSTSRSLDSSPLARLNALLERRRLVTHSRNWPMDFTTFSKVVFYVLIPPLAWAGAAVVELVVDAYLTG